MLSLGEAFRLCMMHIRCRLWKVDVQKMPEQTRAHNVICVEG